jgi:hypothetical protein
MLLFHKLCGYQGRAGRCVVVMKEPVVAVPLFHKLCGYQGRAGRCVVVMKEPVVAVPKFQSFSSHIFSLASQNVTVKV